MAALALLAAVAGSALGGLVEPVWGRARRGLPGRLERHVDPVRGAPGPHTSSGGSRHGRMLERELGVKLPPSAVTGGQWLIA